MCGIVGYVGVDQNTARLRHDIEQACSALRHRGPDDFGYYVEPGVALGVARLAIRDPEYGHQPMRSGSCVVAFNGELYDTAELSSALDAAGVNLQTTCDTEILLEAFKLFDDDVVERLKGMFAIALWNEDRRELILARDRWGEKPLYVATLKDGTGLVFASEVKALQSWYGIDWSVDLNVIEVFLANRYVPEQVVVWNGVSKVPPGCKVRWNGDVMQVDRYYETPRPSESSKDRRTLRVKAQELHVLFSEAINDCLQADRPVGTFLSGGIDSSYVTAVASSKVEALHTFSVAWPEMDLSEEPYSRLIAGRFHTVHTNVTCTPSYFEQNFDRVVDQFDEPFGDDSMIPCTLLAEAAKAEVSVVEGGDGSDELFGGYDRYRHPGTYSEFLDAFSGLPRAVREGLLLPESLSRSHVHASHFEWSDRLST